MIAKHAGSVQMRKNKPLAVVYEIVDEREYEVPVGVRLLVEDGQEIAAGQQLSEGALNPHRILRILGRDATQSVPADGSAEGVPLAGREHQRQAL